MDESIVHLLSQQYPDTYDAILDSFFAKHPLLLRVNTLKTTPNSLAEHFGEEYFENSVRITKDPSAVMQELAGGNFFVQGYGSQMAVKMLSALPGETIADVCSCPGGKSFGAAIDMKNTGTVLSFDIHQNKLTLIEKTAKNLGITIIQTAQRDARTPLPEWEGKLDRVICDVPCSGLGVVSSKPEIRYKKAADFAQLPEIQKAILEQSAKLLKSHGTLVYSTCTINKNENEGIVHSFLNNHKGFSLCEEHTWLPYEEAGEGFYAAKLIKHE